MQELIITTKKVFNATSQTQFTDYNSLNLLNIYKLSSKMRFELRIKNQKKVQQ